MIVLFRVGKAVFGVLQNHNAAVKVRPFIIHRHQGLGIVLVIGIEVIESTLFSQQASDITLVREDNAMGEAAASQSDSRCRIKYPVGTVLQRTAVNGDGASRFIEYAISRVSTDCSEGSVIHNQRAFIAIADAILGKDCAAFDGQPAVVTNNVRSRIILDDAVFTIAAVGDGQTSVHRDCLRVHAGVVQLLPIQIQGEAAGDGDGGQFFQSFQQLQGDVGALCVICRTEGFIEIGIVGDGSVHGDAGLRNFILRRDGHSLCGHDESVVTDTFFSKPTGERHVCGDIGSQGDEAPRLGIGRTVFIRVGNNIPFGGAVRQVQGVIDAAVFGIGESTADFAAVHINLAVVGDGDGVGDIQRGALGNQQILVCGDLKALGGGHVGAIDLAFTAQEDDAAPCAISLSAGILNLGSKHNTVVYFQVAGSVGAADFVGNDNGVGDGDIGALSSRTELVSEVVSCLAAANAGGISAECGDGTAGNRNCATIRASAAANAGCVSTSLRIHRTAGDKNRLRSVGCWAASDAGSTFSSISVHRAAANLNCSIDFSRAIVAGAADTGRVSTARGGNVAAVDNHSTAGTILGSTDAGIEIITTADQFAGAAGLTPDGQTAASADLNAAVDGEVTAVRQNQVHIAVDGDTAADGQARFGSLNHIPAGFQLILTACQILRGDAIA